ncbi:MAG: ATP-grasp domain-containing protein [Microbacteriaceae bacterium]|nr:MAG: ATP-grasp domain-containing protein [Microbacteriaceae bacterium]
MSGQRASRSEHRLLLVTGHRWLDACRHALAAREAGFAVHLLAPKRHPIAALEWVNTVEAFSALRPHRTVANALNAMPFDLVVPIDDLGASALFETYLDGMLSNEAALTVERSLGDPASFGIRHARAEIGQIATRAGLAAPGTWPLREDTLASDLETAGFPAVLKTDGSFGGQQVIVVDDLDAARAGYLALSRPPRLLGAFGQLVLDHDETSLRPALARSRSPVSVQQFVNGGPATMSVAAWEGEMLGYVGSRALQTQPGNGPATIIEPLQHPDLERAARVIASELGLSGLFGLDFVLAPDRSTASLIELNPRATPTAHLRPPSLHRPLFHLLADSLGMAAPPPRPALPEGPIGLFPQAATADPGGTHALPAHLDLPREQDVVDLCRAELATRPPGALERVIRRVF